VNIDKIRSTVEAIETSPPESHLEMSDYVADPGDLSRKGCGTVACIAGWAVILEDGPMAILDDYYCLSPETSEDIAIPWRARRILGLDAVQADALFCGDMGVTKETVRKYVNNTLGISL
jgi:hypothetical protein